MEKVLKKFDYFDDPPVMAPYDSSVQLLKNNGDRMSQSEYAKVIGSLIFLMNCTRLDIAYAVSRPSRYSHNPSLDHWKALKRLLRYLRGTMERGLVFVGFPTNLEG